MGLRLPFGACLLVFVVVAGLFVFLYKQMSTTYGYSIMHFSETGTKHLHIELHFILTYFQFITVKGAT